jgi:hypothetical protein
MVREVTIYVHTIDGRPGTFDGYQICFAANYGRPNKPARSLQQIRREQAKSRANRIRDGFSDNGEYDYRRYVVSV